ncbi:RHS repeat-associated core domain-containing protein [Psychrobacter sp. YGAH215]|uniref:RHS repeat-associated core domain-containing protein n=1 Tax=Psychrobacter sp. YGAH215 TaxID=2596826 RepID=UPI0021DF57AF|nr:RHS repeat-associated core domain-containing protein [Psychrobacter sp. YGAH215]
MKANPKNNTQDMQAKRKGWLSSLMNSANATESTTTEPLEFNLRFAGQYEDSESGYYYNWHRYYNPETGRYLTSDPIGLSGGWNTYVYAEQNPVQLVDPWGLSTIVEKEGSLLKVVGAYKDGDVNIYQNISKGNSCTQKIVGKTIFDDAFISPDTGKPVGIVYMNESIEDHIYKLNTQAWSESIFTVFAFKSIPGGEYDIKANYGEHLSYHGFLFKGRYITLREGGNILAGMNAAVKGLSYDEFQQASGALHLGGLTGLTKHLTFGTLYGKGPKYGENDYQYLRSQYGYNLGIKRIEENIKPVSQVNKK